MSPKALVRTILFVLLLTFTSYAIVIAQEAANKRGFQPGHSYALGDIETINTTNGNVMLHFPLASLPAGHGGMSGAINLVYSSKLYNSETAYFRDQSQRCQINADDVITCPYYTKSLVSRTDEGGWRYAVGFGLELTDRREQYLTVPEENRPVCRNRFGGVEAGYNEMTYVYKLRIVFPDGSSHEVRPSAFHDGFAGDAQADYFDVRPDGRIEDCGGNAQVHTGPISYYSTDGSYLRLDVQHDGDDNWRTNPWTLYLPDGTRVTGGGPASTPQRIYDRNDNYIEIETIEHLNGTDHGATRITDQFNRSILLEYNGAGPGEDKITAAGFGGTVETKVKWKDIEVTKAYWPCSLGGCLQVPQPEVFHDTLSVVERITLPVVGSDVLHYDFSYNAPDGPSASPSVGWGELTGIKLPSGAEVNYEFAQDGLSGSHTPEILRNAPHRKLLSYKEEQDNNNTTITEEWTYNISGGASTVIGPDGSETTEFFNDTNGSFWDSGLTYQTLLPDGRKIERVWKRNNRENYSDTFRGDNAYVKRVYTSIKNAAGTYVKTAIKDYDYDQNGNVTRVAESDWLAYGTVHNAQDQLIDVSDFAAVRITLNVYNNGTAAACDGTNNCVIGSSGNLYWKTSAPRVKNELFSTDVQNEALQPVARTEFYYDAAGNLRQQKKWDSTKGGYSNPLGTNAVSTSNEYADWANGAHGKLLRTFDALGYQTEFTYEAVGRVSELYPTKVETALGTPVQRTEKRQYDLATGLLTQVTDVDNDVSTKTEYDLLGRPKLVQAAFDKPEETRTVTEYFDLARRVVTRSDLVTMGDGKLVSITHYDPLGRVRLQRQIEDASESGWETSEEIGIKVQTRYRYDKENRLSFILTSNPYRAANSMAAASEPAMGWTVSKSDVGGRVVEVSTFEGSSLPQPWGNNATSTGSVSTSYDGYLTTAVDQAQKKRRSKVDALGRLERIDEPVTIAGSDQLGDDNNPLQPTKYDYDALNNLITVTQTGTTLAGTQGTLTRTFTYDSLSRLRTATNPESGTIEYRYDDNGNLIKKIDPRTVGQSATHIETNYHYDELNRNTIITYNDGTPAVNRFYDGAIKGKGLFWYEETCSQTDDHDLCVAGTTLDRRQVTEYDALSRPRSLRQLFRSNSVDFSFDSSRSYNRAGLVTSQQYPSGHTVSYNYDSAGRLGDMDASHPAFSGTLGDGQPRTYAQGLLYAAAGQLRQEQFGTEVPIFNRRVFNSRQQMVQLLASSDPDFGANGAGLRGQLENFYGAADNNGNLQEQTIWVPANELNTAGTGRRQFFHYDALNRLTNVSEQSLGNGHICLSRPGCPGSPLWSQSYKYDSWGNRVVNQSLIPNPYVSKTYDVDWQHNRLKVPDSQTGTMVYDAAGNLIADSYTGVGMPSSASYDANNKMTSAQSGADVFTYNYAADGSRVRRKILNVETWQIYGFDGELLAEYAQNKAAESPTKEYGYRSGQLLVTAENPEIRANVAASANGASATASSELSACGSSWPARSVIDGDRLGSYWGQGGGWADAGSGNFQNDSLEINFGTSRTIDEIDVFTVQDQYSNPAPPTETMTFSLYGLTQYKLQYLDGSTWTDVPGASVSGNNLVWRKFSFAPLTTSKIKLIPQGAVDNGYSRVAEIEAWGNMTPPPKTNVALRSNGAVASASTELAAGCKTWKAAGTIDGDRLGQNWGAGGGWADSTSGNFQNDWLLVEFNGVKTIDEIDVFTVQDGCTLTPEVYYEPNEAMTFSSYGLSQYKLQYLNGPTWLDIPGASVTGNNKVWKKFTFPALTTNKIRLVVQAAADNGYSRVAEVEAWSPNVTTSANAIHWLVSDQLGTPRMVLDQTGNLAGMTRHDYLPFGEELGANIGGRTTAQGYTGDRIRQQFTSKERDIETGLDYFLARYYSSTQGRFTSPDEFTGGPDELYYFVDDAADNPTFYADLKKPQSLNKYQYAYNNPLRWVDPDGHDPEEPEPQDPKPMIPVPVPAGPGGLPVPVTISPGTPGPTDQQIKRGFDSLLDDYVIPKTVNDYLYMASQKIGTAPELTMQPVTVPSLVVPGPKLQALPMVSPAPMMSKAKDTRKVINGLIANAITHVGKINSSDPNDPNRNHWKKEVKAALDRAQKLAQRLKGKAQEAVKQKIKDIRGQIE
jgi:RHS repeat-associated protein